MIFRHSSTPLTTSQWPRLSNGTRRRAEDNWKKYRHRIVQSNRMSLGCVFPILEPITIKGRFPRSSSWVSSPLRDGLTAAPWACPEILSEPAQSLTSIGSSPRMRNPPIGANTSQRLPVARGSCQEPLPSKQGANSLRLLGAEEPEDIRQVNFKSMRTPALVTLQL
jgi:hypothetical protein